MSSTCRVLRHVDVVRGGSRLGAVNFFDATVAGGQAGWLTDRQLRWLTEPCVMRCHFACALLKGQTRLSRFVFDLPCQWAPLLTAVLLLALLSAVVKRLTSKKLLHPHAGAPSEDTVIVSFRKPVCPAVQSVTRCYTSGVFVLCSAEALHQQKGPAATCWRNSTLHTTQQQQGRSPPPAAAAGEGGARVPDRSVNACGRQQQADGAHCCCVP